MNKHIRNAFVILATALIVILGTKSAFAAGVCDEPYVLGSGDVTLPTVNLGDSSAVVEKDHPFKIVVVCRGGYAETLSTPPGLNRAGTEAGKLSLTPIVGVQHLDGKRIYFGVAPNSLRRDANGADLPLTYVFNVGDGSHVTAYITVGDSNVKKEAQKKVDDGQDKEIANRPTFFQSHEIAMNHVAGSDIRTDGKIKDSETRTDAKIDSKTGKHTVIVHIGPMLAFSGVDTGADVGVKYLGKISGKANEVGFGAGAYVGGALRKIENAPIGANSFGNSTQQVGRVGALGGVKIPTEVVDVWFTGGVEGRAKHIGMVPSGAGTAYPDELKGEFGFALHADANIKVSTSVGLNLGVQIFLPVGQNAQEAKRNGDNPNDYAGTAIFNGGVSF